MKWWTLFALLVLGSGAAAPKAAAFSDPALYAESSLQGGGGGRYFTGSALDGYTCAVCHSGGAPPSVSVRGLPLDGYEAGETYEVVVSWTDPEISHALTLDITAGGSEGLRSLTLPSASKVGAEGRCESMKSGDVAAFLLQEEDRTIVGVTDCGASNLTFRFKAPDTPTLRLSAAVVRSDSSATPQGDGVYELSFDMRRSDVSAAVTGSCALSLASSFPRNTTAAWVLLLLCWSRRRTFTARKRA